MGDITNKNDNLAADINDKDNIFDVNDENIDDFSVSKSTQTILENKEPDKEETETKETDHQSIKRKRVKNKVAKRVIIGFFSLVVILVGAFSAYSATLSDDKINYGVYVGNINLGGKTYDEAVNMLDSGNISSVHSIVLNANNSKKYTISGEEIEMDISTDETCERAMGYAKEKGRFINTFKSLYTLINNVRINPVMDYNYDKLTQKLNEIGVDVCGGELVEHNVKFLDGTNAQIVPGKSGFDHKTDEIINEIDNSLLNSVSNEISVTFNKISPDDMSIDDLDNLVYTDPKNAEYTVVDGNVVITNEENGRYIDRKALSPLLINVVEGGQNIPFQFMVSYPEITAAMLRGKLFNATLATYTTRFNAGSVNRSSNISVAAQKINYSVLLPGETFSFNTCVGKRSLANGFKTAPEYQKGQTVQGIGGGTCQVSTTLYSAVLYADLKIVSRTNHSMAVSYVPLGQDATVTDGGTDFKFLNDTKYPIKISATTKGGSITVSIIGTEPVAAKTVKIVHTPVAANVGKAVSTSRVVSDAAGNVIKDEKIGISRYKPHDTNTSATPTQTPSTSANTTIEQPSPTTPNEIQTSLPEKQE